MQKQVGKLVEEREREIAEGTMTEEETKKLVSLQL